MAYDIDTDQIHVSIIRALDKREEMRRCISVITDRQTQRIRTGIKCNFSLEKEKKIKTFTFKAGNF